MSAVNQRHGGTGWVWRLRTCAAVARAALRAMLVYRAGLVISVVVVLLVQIFTLRVVWTSVYADRSSVVGVGGAGEITLATQLAYVSHATAVRDIGVPDRAIGVTCHCGLCCRA